MAFRRVISRAFAQIASQQGTHYKLTYFNLRARAEVARLLFAVASVPFEDFRVNPEDWPKLKKTMPLGQMPVLEVNGKPYCQSHALSRYLARQFGLVGKSPEDEMQADMVVDTLDDLIKVGLPIYKMEDGADKEQKKAEFETDLLVKTLKALETMLEGNQGGSGYFVGDGLTWADLYFFNTMDWLDAMSMRSDLHQYPKLSGLRDRIRSQPQIKAWLAQRPETPL